VSAIDLHAVTLVRDGHVLLDRVELAVASGERLVVLGPSGAGKSSLLRVVAGLETPTAGTVHLDGVDVTAAPPGARDISMVNQEASLQPHLDVARNVAFPLSIHHVPTAEIEERVQAEARVFSLQRLLRRRPNTLSAGQRHDVALARSLVRRGAILLLDEPLARVDARRRDELLRQLLAVQQGYGVTLLAATNDQRVAMSLADRLAVLDRGRLVQVGSPTEVFARPASAFVAGFLGSPGMNLLPGRVRAAVSGVRIDAGCLRVRSFAPAITDLAGREVLVGIRPTDLRPDPPPDATVLIEEVVVRTAFLGAEVEVGLDAGNGRELTAVIRGDRPQRGALFRLAVDPQHIHLFDPGGGAALAHGV
jgi:multiple sugar transport system ATP-binding protein